MKILLMGDASNYHQTLSIGLAELGHDVTVASNGSNWMQTVRDIDISRHKSKIGGALLWLRLNSTLRNDLKGYDVVQICSPIFIEQRPTRVKTMFDRLKRDNGGVFLTALGTDYPFIKMCIDKDCKLRYSEYRVNGKETPYSIASKATIDAWQTEEMINHCRYIYDNVDGVITALYEYHLACQPIFGKDRLAYAGIPIDTKNIDFIPWIPDRKPIKMILACHKGREAEKGADIMLPVLQRLANEMPESVMFEFIQNIPFAEFKNKISEANIVVDQLYSYTPATTALMAMAAGKLTISGAEPEYYDFIGEKEMHPIINADPCNIDSLYKDLKSLIDNPLEIVKRSKEGRDFVIKHNDTVTVAQRFIDFWERRLV